MDGNALIPNREIDHTSNGINTGDCFGERAFLEGSLRDARADEVLRALRERCMRVEFAPNDLKVIRTAIRDARARGRVSRAKLARQAALEPSVVRAFETTIAVIRWSVIDRMAKALGLPTRVVIDEGAFAALKLHADALEILGILRAGLEAGDARIIDLAGSSGALELRVHHCGDHTKVLRWERTRDSYTVVAGWEFRGASLRPIVAPDGGYGFGEVSDARGTGGPWRVRLDLEAAVGEAERFLLGLGCFKLDRYARVEKNESTASAQRESFEVPACDEAPREASAQETLKAQVEAAISSALSELGAEEHALGSANEPERKEPEPTPSRADDDEPIYAVAAAAAGMSGWLDLHESWIALAGGSIDIAELAGHHARLWRERLQPLVGHDTAHRAPGPILCAYEALELTVRATPDRPIPGDVRRVFNSIVGAQIRMLAELLDEFGAQSTEK